MPTALPSSGDAARDTAFLNVFRAFAAFYVVVAHCMIWGGTGLFKLPDPKHAVDVFMIISGFLMTHTNRSGIDTLAKCKRFYLRRFFRIAPAYYVALASAFILAEPYAGGYDSFRSLNVDRWGTAPVLVDFSLANVLAHVSFLFGMIPRYHAATLLPDWSIGLEMQFYAIFPVLYLIAKRFSLLWVCIAAALAAILAAKGYETAVARGYATAFVEPSLLVFKLQYFIVGMLIAAGRPAHLVGAAVVATVAARGYGVAGVPTLAAAGLIAWCWARSTPGWFVPIVRSRLISFMSDCSYSVYLFHGFVLTIAGSRLLLWLLGAGTDLRAATALLAALVLLLVYPLGWIVFNFVEKPGISLGKGQARRETKTVTS